LQWWNLLSSGLPLLWRRLAGLEAQIWSDKLAHNREIKDIKEALRSIASKLERVALALRET